MAMAAAVPTQQRTQQKQQHQYHVQLQAIEDYRRFAALTIQRYFRGWIVRLHAARKEAARREQQQTAAAQQAQACRLYSAARTIQDAWRSYRNQRIYRFYRDLIKFREAADPRQLLRCINAPEAALVDAATGLHIRFRLGGSSFPPILLYKVFTHRPITDIGAFGPRNYAAEVAASKQPTATTSAAAAAAVPKVLQQHQPGSGSAGAPHSRAGWYCRDDRNGWRPVVELQQQLQGEPAGCRPSASNNSGSSSRRGSRQSLALRSHRRPGRLQLAARGFGSGSGKGGAGTAEHPAAAAESGYSSEPELQGGRSAPGSPCAAHGKQQQFYHHSPLVRRAEHAQRLKQRRRQWLLKMYRAGMRGASGGGGGGVSSSGCADGNVSAAPTAGCDVADASCRLQQPQQPPVPCQTCSSEELLLKQLEQQLLLSPAMPGAAAESSDLDTGWDVEQLLSRGLDAGILAWAQTLDFDSYQRDWSATAVTLPSEAAVPHYEGALLAGLQEL